MADNIYSKIMKVRKEFSETTVKKSGKNEFQNFSYLELSDFVPIAIKLCEENGLYTHINIGTITNKEYATMTVVNVDNSEEKVVYSLELPCISKEGAFNNKIQEQTSLSLEKYSKHIIAGYNTPMRWTSMTYCSIQMYYYAIFLKFCTNINNVLNIS